MYMYMYICMYVCMYRERIKPVLEVQEIQIHLLCVPLILDFTKTKINLLEGVQEKKKKMEELALKVFSRIILVFIFSIR